MPGRETPVLAGLRRRALLRLAAGLGGMAGASLSSAALGGCAPAAPPGAVEVPEVYVGLARARALAILDPVTDRVRARLSLAALGQGGQPWRLLVGPQGNAAMLPLSSAAPAIGLIATGDGAAAGWPAQRDAPARRTGGGANGASSPAADSSSHCWWLPVDTGRHTPAAPPALAAAAEVAQGLAADARGFAYVLVGNAAAATAPVAAVVDLARGTVVRRFALGHAGDTAFALTVEPGGRRLLAALWRWDGAADAPSGRGGHGRILVVDTTSGGTVAAWALPDNTVATDLALAPPPPGTPSAAADGTAVYAVMATPGPSLDGDDDWWAPSTRFSLVALEAARLTPFGIWPLDRQPDALSITSDGRYAYFLSGPAFGSPWERQLTALDLSGSGTSGRWPLPEGCLALAVSSVGKVYVADTTGDRLWRLDTRTGRLLSPLALAGAPLALACRQV